MNADGTSGTRRRASVLLLGTFHLQQQDDLLDVMSPAGQAQIEEVVAALCRFRPTKVGVEVMGDWAATVNDQYRAYLAGEFPMTRNEVHQVGFRVAERGGHRQVYPVDAKGVHWTEAPWEELAQYAKAHGQEHLLEFDASLHAPSQATEGPQAFRARLMAMNDPEEVRAGHGVYFSGPFRIGQGEEYPGADVITDWWYSRNLRIFANIQRITESPEDRILVIIGAGHLPILRHCIECSPDHRLVEAVDILGGAS